MPRRGDVWIVDFDPVVGHEQAKQRPALVVSVDGFNNSPAGLLTVLPITSKARPLPSRIEIRPPEGGLATVSYVIGEQVRTVSTKRLGRQLGAVAPHTLRQVEFVLRTLLGL